MAVHLIFEHMIAVTILADFGMQMAVSNSGGKGKAIYACTQLPGRRRR